MHQDRHARSPPSPCHTAALAQATPVGLWKTIDDETKTEKSLIRITDTGGVLSGKIEKVLDPDQAERRVRQVQRRAQGQADGRHDHPAQRRSRTVTTSGVGRRRHPRPEQRQDLQACA